MKFDLGERLKSGEISLFLIDGKIDAYIRPACAPRTLLFWWYLRQLNHGLDFIRTKTNKRGEIHHKNPVEETLFFIYNFMSKY